MKAIFLRSRICISEIAYNTLKVRFANKIVKYILLYFRLLEALKFSTTSQSIESSSGRRNRLEEAPDQLAVHILLDGRSFREIRPSLLSFGKIRNDSFRQANDDACALCDGR